MNPKHVVRTVVFQGRKNCCWANEGTTPASKEVIKHSFEDGEEGGSMCSVGYNVLLPYVALTARGSEINHNYCRTTPI